MDSSPHIPVLNLDETQGLECESMLLPESLFRECPFLPFPTKCQSRPLTFLTSSVEHTACKIFPLPLARQSACQSKCKSLLLPCNSAYLQFVEEQPGMLSIKTATGSVSLIKKRIRQLFMNYNFKRKIFQTQVIIGDNSGSYQSQSYIFKKKNASFQLKDVTTIHSLFT